MNENIKTIVTIFLAPALALTGCVTPSRQMMPQVDHETSPSSRDSQPNESEVVQTISGAKIVYARELFGDSHNSPIEQEIANWKEFGTLIWKGATDSNGFAHGPGEQIAFGGDWPEFAWSYNHGRADGDSILTATHPRTRRSMQHSNGRLISQGSVQNVSTTDTDQLADAAWIYAHNCYPDKFSIPDAVSARQAARAERNSEQAVLVGVVAVAAFAAILWGGAKLLGKGRDMLASSAGSSYGDSSSGSSNRDNAYPTSRRDASTTKTFTVTSDARANETGNEAGASGASSVIVRGDNGTFTVGYWYDWPSSYLISAGRDKSLVGKSVKIYFEGDKATHISCGSGSGRCQIKSFSSQ